MDAESTYDIEPLSNCRSYRRSSVQVTVPHRELIFDTGNEVSMDVLISPLTALRMVPQERQLGAKFATAVGDQLICSRSIGRGIAS